HANSVLQAEDGIRDRNVTGVQTCALPIFRKTKQFIHRKRKRITTELKSLGYHVSNSKVNFYLLKDPSLENQLPLISYLLKKGIVPRHTENFPGLDGRWLRFAIRQEEENNVLMEALTQWKQES